MAAPLLSDLSGMPDGPLPDRDAINDWSLKSFDDYFTAVARHSARMLAQRASECEATGRWTKRWHTTRHAAVLSLLAGAEQAAPEEDRPWHAARLDSYAAAHGLRGWYRHTDYRGKHCIQINHIRTREEADRGRYFVHTAAYMHRPLNHWVVDRDTGRTAYRSFARPIAQQWIEEAEAIPAHPQENPMEQLPLFSDDDVQRTGPARPWHLKWGVVTDTAPDAGSAEQGDEAA